MGHTLSYDAENRILTASGVTYTYDGDGVRVKKSSGKLYWSSLTESDLSGNATADYVFFGGRRIARVDLPSGTVHYYFTDHLGSANVVTNAIGTTIEQESDYYPYGGERVVTAGSNKYKFTGKERDSESGLDYFGARYYASATARWLSPDWAANATAVPYADFGNPQSLNLYSYVGNNPTNRVDPDGHVDPLSISLEVVAGGEGLSVLPPVAIGIGAGLILSYGAVEISQSNLFSRLSSGVTTATANLLAASAMAGAKKGDEAAAHAIAGLQAVLGGASAADRAKAETRIREQEAGRREVQDLQKQLDKATGKAKDAIREKLTKAVETMKGHSKAIEQLTQKIAKDSKAEPPKSQ
ncbi:MAG: hypothetical protein M3P27_06610 [Acidobacteriota bacterium]|nr:hypothetical protein [Acidobacteriota bacterium]